MEDNTDNLDHYDEEEEDYSILLHPRATFKKLFAELDRAEGNVPPADHGESLDPTHFMDDLRDEFPELYNDVVDMRNQAEATITGVLDFFERHGHTRRDVETFLPIRFTDEESH